jgi:prepilin-type N-terminal cleavage/methylation domain-containing protein
MSPIQKAASKEINKKAGFTLIEIIMVVSVIGIAYFYAIPQFNIITGTETAEKLGKLSEDVRSAYDMAVLHGKPHRMVFMLATGEYWLEVADRRDVLNSLLQNMKV